VVSSNDTRGGRHARLQKQFGILDGNDDIIGHHVLHILGGLPDLYDATLKYPVRKCLYGEGRLVAEGDFADIGLADTGVDLHLRQVSGDDEQSGCLKTGRDRLARRDIAGDDRAVNGRDAA
jgi:hypothetical protein